MFESQYANYLGAVDLARADLLVYKFEPMIRKVIKEEIRQIIREEFGTHCENCGKCGGKS